MKKKQSQSAELKMLSRAAPYGKKLYTIPELIRLTRLTRKQVTYWSRIKLLTPTLRDPRAKTGRPSSFYSAEDMVKALVLCDIKKAGFSLKQIQQVASNLKEHGIRLDQNEIYLLTDGYSVYYANSNNEAIDVLKHNRQRLLLVPIHEQVEKLKQVA